MRTTRVVVFAKAPVPGRVKTRLIPALGAEGAARLAGDLLADAVAEALASGLAVELCGDPDPAGWGDLLPAGPLLLAAQGEGDLGARLARAARRVLTEGENVLLIGADCPGLTRALLADASTALAAHDAVIHPALDGGYVLLGLRRFESSLFDAIAWSSPGVAKQTLARLAALGWSVDVREPLADVDEPADLPRLPRESGDPASPSGGEGSEAGFPLSRE